MPSDTGWEGSVGNASALGAVSERDMDLLLLEELAVNPEFLVWLLEEMYKGAGEGASVIDARHSVAHPTLGESDILVTYSSPESGSGAVLIENKINARAQPRQGERYRKRGLFGMETGEWSCYRTCIIAPQRYLDTESDVDNYDAVVSYESIYSWFHARGHDSRKLFRARIVAHAIEQSRRGYTKEVDQRVTRFWRGYWECASSEFPELRLEQPGDKGSGSTWIEFRPEVLGSGRRIYHKLSAGSVDLQIDGAAAQREELEACLSTLLGSDTEVVVTGKSASVRARVPPMDVFADFEEQLFEARAGLRAAFRLVYLARAIPEDLIRADA